MIHNLFGLSHLGSHELRYGSLMSCGGEESDVAGWVESCLSGIRASGTCGKESRRLEHEMFEVTCTARPASATSELQHIYDSLLRRAAEALGWQHARVATVRRCWLPSRGTT